MARSVKDGQRCWIWSRLHSTYLAGTVAAVRGGIATVTSQNGAQKIAVASLILVKPDGSK